MADALETAATAQLVLATRCQDNNASCARCSAEFRCGAVSGEAHCWCFDLPKLPMPDTANSACYCPSCLSELTSS